jgi:hypothetical protein
MNNDLFKIHSLKNETNINEISNEEKNLLNLQNYIYFIEYSKLYNTNLLLKDKLNELMFEKNQLKLLINKFEKNNNFINTGNINDIYTKRKVNEILFKFYSVIEDVKMKLNQNIFVIIQIVKKNLVQKVH